MRSRVLGAFAIAFAFVAVVGPLQRFPEALEFQRQSILSGQLWRLWTGHWVHANTAHFLLNISVALLLYFAFFRTMKMLELLATGIVFSALISGALLLFMPELDWYNGLSGLLHAWVVYASIRRIQAGEVLYWLGPVLVWAKVLFEASSLGGWSGRVLDGVNIITEAHLIGALVGTLAGIAMLALFRHRNAAQSAGK